MVEAQCMNKKSQIVSRRLNITLLGLYSTGVPNKRIAAAAAKPEWKIKYAKV